MHCREETILSQNARYTRFMHWLNLKILYPDVYDVGRAVASIKNVLRGCQPALSHLWTWGQCRFIIGLDPRVKSRGVLHESRCSQSALELIDLHTRIFSTLRQMLSGLDSSLELNFLLKHRFLWVLPSAQQNWLLSLLQLLVVVATIP